MTSCPSYKNLEHLIAGNEPRGPSAWSHVRDCPACQALLDQISDSESMRQWRADAGLRGGRLEEGPGLTRVLSRWRPRLESQAAETPADALAGAISFLGAPGRVGDLGTFGPYAIQDELGRGGMGVVLRAWDPALERTVALKVLRPELATERARARFLQEAQAAARVTHDQLVRVYGTVNPPDGLPYLVMEYLRGPTLAELIREGSLQPGVAANLISQAADGLAAAHAAGLIHRDIKPANIMLDGPEGRAKIMDFGLARLGAAPSGLTQEGFLAGTPVYMSPEQAGGLENLDARTDVYSLGVTLYEALTGETPFRGAHHLLIQQVIHNEPPSPRILNDSIPRDLETICLKAMAKESSRRYATAADMAEDLRRWRRGEPIKARATGVAERTWRWCRRKPRLAVLGGAVLALLLIITAGSITAAVVVNQARARAEAALRQADANADAARLAEEKAATNAQAAGAHFSLALTTLSTLIHKVEKQLGAQSGTLALREQLLKTALEGLNQIATSAQKNANSDSLMIDAHDRLGDLFQLLGHTREAREQFDQARALSEYLIAGGTTAAKVRRQLAISLDKLGALTQLGTDFQGAAVLYRKAMAIRQNLAAADPKNFTTQRELGVSKNKLGDIYFYLGDPQAARLHYQEAIQIEESPEADAQDPMERLADLRFGYGRLGQVCLSVMDIPAAEAAYQKSLDYAKARVASMPNNVQALREVEITIERLGSVRLFEGNCAGAETAYKTARDMAQAKARTDPANAEWQRDLATTHSLVGDVYLCEEKYDAAREDYRQALNLCETEAKKDPGSMQKLSDLLVNCGKLAEIETRSRHYGDAASCLKIGLDWCRPLLKGGEAPTPLLQTWYSEALANQAVYASAAKEGLTDVERLLKQPKDLALGLLQLRALDLARQGRHQEAAAAAELFRKQAGSDTRPMFFILRVYSRCTRALLGKRTWDQLAGAERAQCQRYIDLAYEAGRLEMRDHPNLAQEILIEPEVYLLRGMPGFSHFIQETAALKNRRP